MTRRSLPRGLPSLSKQGEGGKSKNVPDNVPDPDLEPQGEGVEGEGQGEGEGLGMIMFNKVNVTVL